MMGRQRNDQAQFFYPFLLDERVPTSHLLRRIDLFVTQALADTSIVRSRPSTATRAAPRSIPC
jgi:hypothetical protein